MKSLSRVGLGLSLVFGCLLLALIAEVYYLLWWKKRIRSPNIEDGCNRSPAREFFYMFCCKKPSSLSSTALNPQELWSSESQCQANRDLWLRPFGEDSVEGELLRLQNLSGPPRFLFTIKEETKEDLESEDGGKSRKCSRNRSLSDLILNMETETPFLTPLTSPSNFSPPLTPLNSLYNHHGFNPLFESSSDAEFNKIRSSPPPKFKFLREAEEKLLRRKLLEEAKNCSHNRERFVKKDGFLKDEENGSSYITLIVSKNIKERDYPSSSSQVLPLVASPPSFRPLTKKKPFLQ